MHGTMLLKVLESQPGMYGKIISDLAEFLAQNFSCILFIFCLLFSPVGMHLQ